MQLTMNPLQLKKHQSKMQNDQIIDQIKTHIQKVNSLTDFDAEC